LKFIARVKWRISLQIGEPGCQAGFGNCRSYDWLSANQKCYWYDEREVSDIRKKNNNKSVISENKHNSKQRKCVISENKAQQQVRGNGLSYLSNIVSNLANY